VATASRAQSPKFVLPAYRNVSLRRDGRNLAQSILQWRPSLRAETAASLPAEIRDLHHEKGMARFYFAAALGERLPRSPAVDHALWWLEATLPRVLWWLSGALPIDAASAVAGFVGGIIGPHLRKQWVILRKLEIALPDLDDRARRKIAREIWTEAGRVIAEFALLDRICGLKAADRLEMVFRHDLAPASTGERPAMFVTAHLSNSELAVTAARATQHRFDPAEQSLGAGVARALPVGARMPVSPEQRRAPAVDP
jgi:lipid A biosynthesis acyltransferase